MEDGFLEKETQALGPAGLRRGANLSKPSANLRLLTAAEGEGKCLER